MTDITMYTDDELSLSIPIVNNEEFLYLLAQESVELLLETIKELFIYTDTQLEILKEDLDDILCVSKQDN